MKTELNRIPGTSTGKEVDLFRNMATVLSGTYAVTFVEETHREFVIYQSSMVHSAARREISDLWIITYSPRLQRSRMTFLQAKYHRGNMGPSQPSFHAEYFQYELMSQRPTLTANASRRFAFPNDILSFSCLHSLGSYGVFFIDDNGEIDMSYCCAHYLSTRSPTPKTYAPHGITLDIPVRHVNSIGLCVCGIWPELICCFDIDTFTNSLLSLEIGAELVGTSVTGFVTSTLQSKKGNPVVSEFLGFLNGGEPPFFSEGQVNFEGLPCNLLLINVDRQSEINLYSNRAG